MNPVMQYQEGHKTIKEIAASHGRSVSWVYRRLREAGVTLNRQYGRGPDSTNWKGGTPRTTGGYVWRWVGAEGACVFGSMVNSKGYVLEHRAVMAEHLGRPLRKTEQVHHKNGQRDDNHLENLQLRQGAHGSGIVLVCAHCGSKNLREENI